MKSFEDKHVASPVDLVAWCDTMDLLAMANLKGEVQLHRLRWSRVWCLPPPAETSLVTAMVWRPDGKVLAIGYNCGNILVVDVEDKEVLFKHVDNSHGAVTCLSWSQKELTQKYSYKMNENFENFLPELPPLNSSYKKGEDCEGEYKRCKIQDNLNILMAGYENGQLHMNVFGIFPCGILHLDEYLNVEANDFKIADVHLSVDFKRLHVCIEERPSKSLKMAIFDTEILATYSDELHALASKYDHIMNSIHYLDQTMTSIVEAWEQILLEMDAKLEKYASQVIEGGVSADLLELLMFGVPSAELELFLLQDLTAKGLKKFGTSIELSYSTIQKLVLKQLNTVGHNLTYHLAEMRGLARIAHRYQILGLKEEAVSHAILSSNAFINKCLELQQVIDHSMKNYRAFFRWLYVVIVRLMDEQIPPEIIKTTQQDLTYIAEFLQNFDKCGKETPEDANSQNTGEKRTGKFNLERLGQYLVNKNLTSIPETGNSWLKFLEENSCLARQPDIIQIFKSFSLVQQQEYLKSSIKELFSSSAKSLVSEFSFISVINCIHFNEVNTTATNSPYKISQINVPEQNSVHVAFIDFISDKRGLYFVEFSQSNEISPKLSYVYFQGNGNSNDSKLEGLEGQHLKVVDLQFYSTEIISILLENPNENDLSIFIQFPVKLVCNISKPFLINENFLHHTQNLPEINGFGLLESGSCRILDKISPWKMAVSGGRKVAVVVSKTRRRIRSFEMEDDGDDDDDDTLDTTPKSQSTTQMSDTSQNVMNESNLHNISEINEAPTTPDVEL